MALHLTLIPFWLYTFLALYLATFLALYLDTFLALYLATFLALYLDTFLDLYLNGFPGAFRAAKDDDPFFHKPVRNHGRSAGQLVRCHRPRLVRIVLRVEKVHLSDDRADQSDEGRGYIPTGWTN
eukprot:1190144-Prorocentrum_minimum.AAC.1